jgi:hypothetical protein
LHNRGVLPQVVTKHSSHDDLDDAIYSLTAARRSLSEAKRTIKDKYPLLFIFLEKFASDSDALITNRIKEIHKMLTKYQSKIACMDSAIELLFNEPVNLECLRSRQTLAEYVQSICSDEVPNISVSWTYAVSLMTNYLDEAGKYLPF